MDNTSITQDSQPFPIEIVGSSTFGRYPKQSSALTQNMYISDGWLINFPGYKKKLESVITARGRGLFFSVRGNVLIAVYGSAVYRIDKDFNIVFIGNLVTEVGEVFMDENLNNQIAIVDGLNLYIINHTLPPNLTLQIGAPLNVDLVPNFVKFHDTFFLIGNANTSNNGARWYAYSAAPPTDPNFQTTVIATTQLALQTKPDYAIAIVPIPSQANNVLVFGRTCCEIHTNIGGTQNYRRNSTVNVDFGCLSEGTIASNDQYIVWLASNQSNKPVIMVYNGQSATSISTDGISYLLSTIRHPKDSTAFFYKQDGHLFYQLTFYNVQDNITLMYDFNTQKFFNLTDQYENFHPALDVAYFEQDTYFLSLSNGSLYTINSDISYIDENIVTTNSPLYNKDLIYDIPRTRICEAIRRDNSERFIVNRFTFTINQGDDARVSDLSILNAYATAIITEDAFTPPDSGLVTEDDYPIVLEQGIGANDDAIYFETPSSLTYIPRVDMTISKDSGVTWSSTVTRELNAIGNRQNILRFANLGRSNDLTIKLRFWGLGDFIVSNGQVELY